MGGGVVGDLAGFAAAVLLRGVDYIQVPTTLLAQVDSSVGGKNGINSKHGKNLIGAFHQPRAVLIDTSTLETLPARELQGGYAEIVKHAFIKDRAFFEWLEENGRRVLERQPLALARAIGRSVEIKAAVVAADETESSGLRALLNFGHTFAHAYEALAGYDGRLLHGEAVSLGMSQAFRLSRDLGLCNGQDAGRALAHLRGLRLPTRRRELALEAFSSDAVLRAMRRDKKVEAGALRFVLARGLGDACLCADVPEDAVRHVLDRDE
jgi:3-dehydroquinate synthase